MNVGRCFWSTCVFLKKFLWLKGTNKTPNFKEFVARTESPRQIAWERKCDWKYEQDMGEYAKRIKMRTRTSEISWREDMNNVKYLTSNAFTQKTSNQPFKRRLDVCRMGADESKEGWGSSVRCGVWRSGPIGSLSELHSALSMRLGIFSVLFLTLHGLGWLAKRRNWLQFNSMHVLHRFAVARLLNNRKSRLIVSTAAFSV